MPATVFIAIGAVKGTLVDQPWYRGGIEVLAVGGGAGIRAGIVAEGRGRVAVSPPRWRGRASQVVELEWREVSRGGENENPHRL
jgi:hypothetical protein